MFGSVLESFVYSWCMNDWGFPPWELLKCRWIPTVGILQHLVSDPQFCFIASFMLWHLARLSQHWVSVWRFPPWEFYGCGTDSHRGNFLTIPEIPTVGIFHWMNKPGNGDAVIATGEVMFWRTWNVLFQLGELGNSFVVENFCVYVDPSFPSVGKPKGFFLRRRETPVICLDAVIAWSFLIAPLSWRTGGWWWGSDLWAATYTSHEIKNVVIAYWVTYMTHKVMEWMRNRRWVIATYTTHEEVVMGMAVWVQRISRWGGGG